MQTLAPFLAGLGLFFCGIHFLSSSLTPLAGRRLRLVVTRVVKKPWLAAVTGIVAGVVTQSTNAVTFVVVGLVNAGVIDKRRAILIPTWAHVGTSALVVLVAVDFRIAASYVVALAGFAVYFGLDRHDRARHAVGTLLGLGLLFLGMEMLKTGSVPLRDLLISEGVVAAAGRSPALLLLLGAGLTIVCQFSTVVGAIAVAGVSVGLLEFSGACWLVYGANLGAAFNLFLLSKTLRGEAKQIALIQVLQKIFGFACALILIAAGLLTDQNLVQAGTFAVANSPAGALGWVFLLYQVAGSLFCTVFFRPIVAVLERIAPASPLQEMSRPAFLIDEALVEPSLAVELVGREEKRLLERLPSMLDGIRADGERATASPSTLREAGAAITRAMAAYLEAIIDAKAERADREKVVRLQHRTANLNALHEALEEFVTASHAARQWQSSGRVADHMIEALHTLLTQLVEATASEEEEERQFVLSLLGHRDEMMEKMRQRVLREDPDMPAKAQEALFATTMLFERIVWLARRGAMLLVPERAGTGTAPSSPAV